MHHRGRAGQRGLLRADLGLRLVKKTVNQDDPTVYHLFYADERGSAGSDITFFEYPDSPRGRAGAGMVHRIAFRVASERVARLLAGPSRRRARRRSLVFDDPEGLTLELVVDDSGEEPLVAKHPEIPEEHALRGFAGVRAYTRDPEQSRPFLEGALGFEPGFVARGDKRSGFYVYDVDRARGVQGAGTVHHVAWASTQEDHEAWRAAVERAGLRPTPVIDRFYFKSIYFREPSGVLFEIATLGPGFAVDEDAEHLGERLSLPPDFEHLREQRRAGADAAAEPARRARRLGARLVRPRGERQRGGHRDSDERPDEVRRVEDAAEEDQEEERHREPGRGDPELARLPLHPEQPGRERQPDEQRAAAGTGTGRCAGRSARP